jgi:thioredoxin 1
MKKWATEIAFIALTGAFDKKYKKHILKIEIIYFLPKRTIMNKKIMGATIFSVAMVIFSWIIADSRMTSVISAKQPVYLHEHIQNKTTKAWDPFLNPIIGQGKVVLQFFAYYCGPCRNMHPLLEDLAAEMAEFTFVKVQWELFDVLTKRFNIQSIPTLIFLLDGKEVGRYDGGPVNKEQLAQIITQAYS